MNAELLTLYGEEDYEELGFLSDIAKGVGWLAKKGIDEVKYQQKRKQKAKQKAQAPAPSAPVPVPSAQTLPQKPGAGFLSSPNMPLYLGAGALVLVLLMKKGRR